MEAILVGNVGPRELRLHRGDVALVELHCLEIGEAPPDLAEFGGDVDGATIGGDSVRLTPDGF